MITDKRNYQNRMNIIGLGLIEQKIFGISLNAVSCQLQKAAGGAGEMRVSYWIRRLNADEIHELNAICYSLIKIQKEFRFRLFAQ